MRGKSLAIAAAALVSIATGAPAQDWRGSGRVEGTVKDPSGNPVDGATISLRWTDGKGPDAHSNKKGHWAVLGLMGGVWNVDVSAPGLQTKKLTYNVSQAARNPPIDVSLEPAVQAQAQPAQEQFSIGGQKVSKETSEAIDKANAAWAQQNWTEARAQYERALQELPANQSLLEHVELACYQAKQYDDALQYATKVVAVDPANSTSLLMIAEIQLKKGKLEEAQAALSKVPDEKITDPATYLNMGIGYYNKNRAEEAEAWFTKAIARSPESADNADAYYYRGLARFAEKHPDDAKKDFEKYMQLAPTGPNADTVKEILQSMAPRPRSK